jgi:F420-0:gamma-glutamyl ligase-like protein
MARIDTRKFKNVKLVHYGTVHANAQCTEPGCDWTNQEYKGRSCADQANAHAKETGHEVLVEKGVHYKVTPINPV